MKKIVIILVLILTLTSCSVQEKMNTEIFIERFSKCGLELDFNNAEKLYENGKCFLFIKDSNGTEFLIELFTDKKGNVYKVTLSCSNINEQGNFILLAKNLINVYSYDDNSDFVLKEICKDGTVGKDFMYYETQWYYYSTASTDQILFFSVENKKLSTEKNTELTLKQNDIYITKGSE